MAKRRGFTLIELLVVLAIIGTLASYVSVRYAGTTERAKETALRETLLVLRQAIDRHAADTGEAPASLEALREAGYLRAVPVDPITESAETWILEPPADRKAKGVADVRSGAPGTARDGSAYAAW